MSGASCVAASPARPARSLMLSLGNGGAPSKVVGATCRRRYCRGPTLGAATSPAPTSATASGHDAVADATDARGDGGTKYAGRRVVLTRENGKNGDMKTRLEARGIECVEMPLIETAVGADRAALPAALADSTGWAWVCITSPEAAAVFLEAWRTAGRPDVPVACVGTGTAKIIAPEYASGALTAPTFTPSRANAVTLVAELPLPPPESAEGGDSSENRPPRVLYPASANAATTLQDGLAARGAAVTRLNTYSTERVTSVAVDVLAHAMRADVVTFGSPSAVKAWVQLSGLAPAPVPAGTRGGGADAAAAAAHHPLYACIGRTSAKACHKIDLPGVLFPEDPGLDGWEGTVLEALDSLLVGEEGQGHGRGQGVVSGGEQL